MKIGLELAGWEGPTARLCARIDITEADEEALRLQERIPEAIIGDALGVIRPTCPYFQCGIGATFSRHITEDTLVARISCERDEYSCRPTHGDATAIRACGHLATVFSEYGLADESALK